jgi:hypothetical protein
MKQRGRKSSAALSVVTSLPQRPEPPAELSVEQALEWKEIVARLPADWFQRESHALLVQYCRHVTSARFVAKMIDSANLNVSKPEDLKRFDRLLRLEEREGAAVARLATKLRLTHQSRYTPCTAATAAGKGTSERKPWEDD